MKAGGRAAGSTENHGSLIQGSRATLAPIGTFLGAGENGRTLELSLGAKLWSPTEKATGGEKQHSCRQQEMGRRDSPAPQLICVNCTLSFHLISAKVKGICAMALIQSFPIMYHLFDA